MGGEGRGGKTREGRGGEGGGGGRWNICEWSTPVLSRSI